MDASALPQSLPITQPAKLDTEQPQSLPAASCSAQAVSVETQLPSPDESPKQWQFSRPKVRKAEAIPASAKNTQSLAATLRETFPLPEWSTVQETQRAKEGNYQQHFWVSNDATPKKGSPLIRALEKQKTKACEQIRVAVLIGESYLLSSMPELLG